MESLPAADEDRRGEVDNMKTAKGPPDSKPQSSMSRTPEASAALVQSFQEDLRRREVELQRQRRIWESGRTPSGFFQLGRQVNKRGIYGWR